MRELLIFRLFNEFNNLKGILTKLLSKQLNEFTIEVSDKYNKALLIVKVEGEKNNDYRFSYTHFPR